MGNFMRKICEADGTFVGTDSCVFVCWSVSGEFSWSGGQVIGEADCCAVFDTSTVIVYNG